MRGHDELHGVLRHQPTVGHRPAKRLAKRGIVRVCLVGDSQVLGSLAVDKIDSRLVCPAIALVVQGEIGSGLEIWLDGGNQVLVGGDALPVHRSNAVARLKTGRLGEGTRGDAAYNRLVRGHLHAQDHEGRRDNHERHQ